MAFKNVVKQRRRKIKRRKNLIFSGFVSVSGLLYTTTTKCLPLQQMPSILYTALPVQLEKKEKKKEEEEFKQDFSFFAPEWYQIRLQFLSRHK